MRTLKSVGVKKLSLDHRRYKYYNVCLLNMLVRGEKKISIKLQMSFQKAKPKISASRRLFLKVFHLILSLFQSLQCLNEPCCFRLTEAHTCVCVCVFQTKMLKKAMSMLENDKQIKKEERERTLAERVPPLQMSGMSLQDLQVIVDSFKKSLLTSK